jgi:hypothetical protein
MHWWVAGLLLDLPTVVPFPAQRSQDVRRIDITNPGFRFPPRLDPPGRQVPLVLQAVRVP